MSRLIVIVGCNVFASAAKGVVRIPEGLGFRSGVPKKGRALIGFPQLIPGKVADRFFRIFFAMWKNNDISLDQARIRAENYIRKWANEHRGQTERSTNYMWPTDADISNKMIIEGDRSLKFSDLTEKGPCLTMKEAGGTVRACRFGPSRAIFSTWSGTRRRQWIQKCSSVCGWSPPDWMNGN